MAGKTKQVHCPLWDVSCEIGIAVMSEIGYGNHSSELVFLGENARQKAHEFLTQKFGKPIECDPPESFGRWLWTRRETIQGVEHTLGTYWLSPVRVLGKSAE